MTTRTMEGATPFKGKGVPAWALIGLTALGAGWLIFRAMKSKPEEAPGVISFACPYCGLSFSSYEALANHINNRHPLQETPAEEEAAVIVPETVIPSEGEALAPTPWATPEIIAEAEALVAAAGPGVITTVEEAAYVISYNKKIEIYQKHRETFERLIPVPSNFGELTPEQFEQYERAYVLSASGIPVENRAVLNPETGAVVMQATTPWGVSDQSVADLLGYGVPEDQLSYYLGAEVPQSLIDKIKASLTATYGQVNLYQYISPAMAAANPELYPTWVFIYAREAELLAQGKTEGEAQGIAWMEFGANRAAILAAQQALTPYTPVVTIPVAITPETTSAKTKAATGYTTAELMARWGYS